jgi:TatD DNase family protein
MAIFERLIVSTRYVGEIGLDFSRSYFPSKEAQIDVFTQIIKWCQRDGNKVLSIHSVRSDKYVIDILKDNACTRNNLCILHWFSGAIKELERAIEIGCYFSINDYMLKSTNGRKIIQIIPAERLLLESDAPFILAVKTPEMLKKILTDTLKVLAAIRGTEVSEIILRTSRKLFEGEI